MSRPWDDDWTEKRSLLSPIYCHVADNDDVHVTLLEKNVYTRVNGYSKWSIIPKVMCSGWNLSQYLPAHSCSTVTVTGESKGFCHLCLFLQNTHSAVGHPGGSFGSLRCLKKYMWKDTISYFRVDFKWHCYSSRQGEPRSLSVALSKQKQSLPFPHPHSTVHQKGPHGTMLKFN